MSRSYTRSLESLVMVTRVTRDVGFLGGFSFPSEAPHSLSPCLPKVKLPDWFHLVSKIITAGCHWNCDTF